MQTIMSVRDLCKIYGSNENVCHAVNQVKLDITQSEFISIMGASGSGKSTLIHLLAAMTEPTSGEIIYKGKNILKLSSKEKAAYRGREIGFVFQEDNLLNDFSTLQNISLPGYLYEKRSVVNERAEKWINFLKMEDQRHKYPNELSGGQKQMAAIVRGAINKPAILFLDEPTGSLDMESGKRVLDLLVKFNQAGQTIVMVTHDVSAAVRADKVLQIQDGSIYQTTELGKYKAEQEAERKTHIYSMIYEGVGRV